MLARGPTERVPPRRLSARPPPPSSASREDAIAHPRRSRTYEPNDPRLDRRKVRPFRLDTLERFSQEYRDIHRALLEIMPEAVFAPSFLASVRQLVSRYTEMDIDLWMDSVRLAERTQLRGIVPGSTLLAVIGLAPLTEKVLLEVDVRFVYRVVDSLLGGHGVRIDAHRPLTDIEQGVFSFVLLKVLGLFARGLEHPEQVAVRLEDMRTDLRSAADIVRRDTYWLCATWKMNYNLDIGYVRLLLPASLPRRIVTERPPPDSTLARRIRAQTRRRMHRLAGARVSCPVIISRVALTREQIRTLDPGDIVVLDECTVQQLGADGVRGSARLTVGYGRRGVVHGVLGVQEGEAGAEVTFEVSHIETYEIPISHGPRDAHGPPDTPEKVIAAYEAPRADGSENDDGPATPDDDRDEDWGLDDEDGNNEEHEDDDRDADAHGEDPDDASEEMEHRARDHEEVGAEKTSAPEAAEPLLGDVPIDVAVEIGRVELTADEVLRLRNGHLMELGRSPTEPVDLVVGGKRLAKGELIEIEGKLGVKILSLVQDGDP